MQRFCIRTKASHIVLGFPHRLACALLTAALFSGCSILNSGDGKVIDYVSREPVPHAAVELSCSVPRRGHGHDTKILRTESGPDGSFHFDSKDIGDCTFFDARGIKDGYGLDHMTDVLTRPDLENYSRVQKFVYLIKESDQPMVLLENLTQFMPVVTYLPSPSAPSDFAWVFGRFISSKSIATTPAMVNWVREHYCARLQTAWSVLTDQQRAEINIDGDGSFAAGMFAPVRVLPGSYDKEVRPYCS
jgi:hypothetical protein